MQVKLNGLKKKLKTLEATVPIAVATAIGKILREINAEFILSRNLPGLKSAVKRNGPEAGSPYFSEGHDDYLKQLTMASMVSINYGNGEEISASFPDTDELEFFARRKSMDHGSSSSYGASGQSWWELFEKRGVRRVGGSMKYRFVGAKDSSDGIAININDETERLRKSNIKSRNRQELHHPGYTPIHVISDLAQVYKTVGKDLIKSQIKLNLTKMKKG